MAITPSLFFLVAAIPGFAYGQLRTVDERNLRSVLQRYPNNAVQYVPIGEWDVSRVTDFSGLFVQRADFNDDITTWDTSSGTNMAFMFEGCESFNQNLNSWDVGNVRDMGSMFTRARAFNGDISSWDVSKVENLSGFLSAAAAFNQDLSSWDVGSVDTMSNMFAQATIFESDLSGWDVSNVDDMEAMFFQVFEFNSDISGWDVSNVKTMDSMFFAARSFNVDLSAWETAQVENMFNMFRRAASFSQSLCWDLSGIMPTEGQSGVFEAFASSGGAAFNQFCTNAAENSFYSNSEIREDSSADDAVFESATTPPTMAPAPAECPSGSIPFGDFGCICFSGDTMVEIEDKGSTMMKDVMIGDKVHVGNNKFEQVYSFGHYNAFEAGEYLTFNEGLEISPTHMIAEANRGFVPASMINVGDMLISGADGSHVEVKSIVSKLSQGMYAPFTASGKIVVNGMIASTYVTMQEDSSVLQIGDISTGLTWQFLARTFEVPHRAVCSLIGGCTAEKYTAEGISEWVAVPRELALWLNTQGTFVAGLVWLPILAVVSVIVATEFLLTAYGGLIIVGILAFMSRTRTTGAKSKTL